MSYEIPEQFHEIEATDIQRLLTQQQEEELY